MEDEVVTVPKRRSKWLPVAVVGAGTVLVLAPLVFVWRLKPKRLGVSPAAAPPRRVGALSGAVSSTASTSRFTLPAPEFPIAKPTLAAPPPSVPQDPDSDDADWGVPPSPPDPNDSFNPAFYTARAFGTATLIVGSIGFAGLWSLRSYLGVDNAKDFGVQMRLAIMNWMPTLALRMRNSLTSLSESASAVLPESLSERPWSWDEAEARLSTAYDKGGLGAWADAAAREVEEEAKIEMVEREKLKTTMSIKKP